MEKINCNVIQDILPLYIDDVVSDDTKELVEEHLQNCEICQRVYHETKTDLENDMKVSVQTKESSNEANDLKNFRKFLKKRKIKKLLSMFLVCVLAVNSAWFGQTDKVQAEVTNKTGNYKVSGDDYINRVSVHDPSVVKDKKTGMYYVFGSHLACAKSKDLKQWEYVYTNIKDDYKKLFKEPWDGWAKKATNPKDGLSGRMWAPDVVWNETMQKWCMYMSIDGDNWVSSICLLTADNIEGPYEYKGIVVYSGMNNPKVKMDLSNTDVYKVLGEGADLSRYQSTNESCINAIDPSIQTDDKGNMYMTYGSWSAGIYQIKLDPSTGLRDYSKTYETKLNESDAYYGVKIAGGFYCSGEGPYILKGKDYYYLFVSYGNLEAKGGYQMRVYRSKEVTGPYLDDNGVSAIRTKAEEIKKTGMVTVFLTVTTWKESAR